jgi:hypothetical protein
MNKAGKVWLTRRTADIIKKLFPDKKPARITIEWKESLMKRNHQKPHGRRKATSK